jgi:hypothetical protein
MKNVGSEVVSLMQHFVSTVTPHNLNTSNLNFLAIRTSVLMYLLNKFCFDFNFGQINITCEMLELD